MALGDKFTSTIGESENVLFVIRRHPAGLVPIYLFALFGIALSMFAVKALSINDHSFGVFDLSDAVWSMLLVAIITIVIVATVIARQIFWANELIVTEENIIQILRQSLLSQNVSQLNLGKVQDVSVSQRGFWQFWLKYGTIIIETAGEAPSYRFTYAPNPNDIATKIIRAHDDYLEKYGMPKQTITGAP